MSEKPTLRPIDFQPVFHKGERLWLLRDPLALTDEQLLFPPALAQMLQFCDGSKTVPEIHLAFSSFMNNSIPLNIVSDTIQRLNAAALLDNEYARSLQKEQLNQYRVQPHRPPALAGISYPASPTALAAELQAYTTDSAATDEIGAIRAAISPHIDYPRGGPVYGKLWPQLKTAIEEAELILIFGTDHNGGNLFNLTRQSYATPFGILPTDTTLIDRWVESIGEESAFAYELHHKNEHAIELSAVWLHYIAPQIKVPVIPILCGGFYQYLHAQTNPQDDAHLTAMINQLQTITRHKKTLAIASVDFAHVGPAFGDPNPLSSSEQAKIKEFDYALIDAICTGDHAAFYQQIAQINDAHRICGFAPIYHMLRYLDQSDSPPIQGKAVAYAHCPADEPNHSLVSISSLLLS